MRISCSPVHCFAVVLDDPQGEMVRLEGVHVFVVDDDADARAIYKDLLTYAGASVVTCASATIAARALRHLRPDVIISARCPVRAIGPCDRGHGTR